MGGTPRYSCALAWGLVALLAAHPAALAQAKPPTDAKAEAQERYQVGLQAYNVGDFDVAIREWKLCYRLHSSPQFLFNIAQAYRGKSDYQQAAFFFNAYLRERPDAPNSDEVIALRDEMEGKLAEQRKAAEAAAKAERDARPETKVDTAATVSASSEHGGDGRSLKLAGMITGGAGVALVAIGAVLVVSASSTADELEQAAADGEPFSRELQDKESRGERNGLLGVTFLAAGSVAVVAGGVSYYLGWRRGREAPGVAVAPLPGGGVAVGARLEF